MDRSTQQRLEKAQPLYIPVSRTQEVFGFSASTVYRWANAGKIRIYKDGPGSLLKVQEVVDMIEGKAPQRG